MRIVKAAPVMAKVRDDIDQVFDRLFRTTFAPEALLRTSAPAPEAWLPPFALLETEAEAEVVDKSLDRLTAIADLSDDLGAPAM